MAVQFLNDELVSLLSANFLSRNDVVNRWGNIVSSYLALPGLVGFWPMSSVQRSTGNVYDLSGQGRALTYSGNPTFNISNLMPYADLDGTGDYLSRVSETDLNVTGTETIFASGIRGLTFGGLFYPTSSLGAQGLIGKSVDTNGPYQLYNENGVAVLFRIRNSADTTNHDVRVAITLNAWNSIIGRYIPSSQIRVWNGDIVGTNTTSIPAAILSAADNFAIGGLSGGTSLFTGRCALCFLCANALPDAIISSLLEQVRVMI